MRAVPTVAVSVLHWDTSTAAMTAEGMAFLKDSSTATTKDNTTAFVLGAWMVACWVYRLGSSRDQKWVE